MEIPQTRQYSALGLLKCWREHRTPATIAPRGLLGVTGPADGSGGVPGATPSGVSGRDAAIGSGSRAGSPSDGASRSDTTTESPSVFRGPGPAPGGGAAAGAGAEATCEPGGGGGG